MIAIGTSKIHERNYYYENRALFFDRALFDMRKRGLEPLRGNPLYHLKVARLPIPPLSQDVN